MDSASHARVDEASRQRGEVELLAAMAAVLEGWRTVVVVVGGISVLVAVLLLFQRQKFRAALRVMPVAGASYSTAGLAASILAGGAQTGIQATPPFVEELVRLPGVQMEVALSPVSPGASESIIRRLSRDERSDSVPTVEIPDVIGRLVKTSVNRETGTVTISVDHSDSTLARALTSRVIGVVTRSFISASRAQASELRRAQALRVDSASTQFQRAQSALVQFSSRNRTIAPFSLQAVQQSELQVAASIAQQVYLQAMTDFNSAIAQELQETPAVVVIDSIPQVLPPVRRHRVLKMLLVVILTTGLVVFFLVARESRRPHALSEPDPTARLREATRGMPLFHWLRGRTTAKA